MVEIGTRQMTSKRAGYLAPLRLVTGSAAALDESRAAAITLSLVNCEEGPIGLSISGGPVRQG